MTYDLAYKDIGTRFKEAIFRESDELRKQWLTKRPKLELPNIRELTFGEIQSGILRKQFPIWYKLAVIEQDNDWHSKDVLTHTLKVLSKVRNWYRNRRKLSLSQQLIVEDYFNAPLWDKTRMQWYEWFILFHDVGKLTTFKRWKKQTQFIGHELAGGQLIGKWLSAVDIQLPAERYIRSMVTDHATINALLDDPELTHKGVLIHAKRQFNVYELLELFIFTRANMQASQLKKKQPHEYARRKAILDRSIEEILDEIENEIPD